MRHFRLRTSLTLFYAAVSTLLLATTGALFYNLLAYQLDSDLQAELSERGAALRGYLRIEGGKVSLAYDAADPEESFFIGNATHYFQIYDAVTGSLITRSEAMRALGPQYAPDEAKGLVRGPDFTHLGTDQVELLLHNDRIQTADGRSYLVQVGAPLTHRNAALRQLFNIILLLLPAGIVLAVLSGYWMSGRVLRPLEELGAAARDMTISDLHRRLPRTGNRDELDRLAEIFNEMFGRLEAAVAQMKDFTASISHELRTPLTALRGEAEVALASARSEGGYRRVLESQLEEFGKLSHLIDRMLTIARAEAGQIKLARSVVNLSNLARSLAEQMEIVAASKGITVTAELDDDVAVIGDEGWLERAILNLLDNAIKFTPAGGRVDVRVHMQDGEAMLEVLDTGIGIEAEALPHVFERFYRADPSRSKQVDGAGLGLSLVEWIVREQNGRIQVQSRAGHGSNFRILLPVPAENPGGQAGKHHGPAVSGDN